MSKKKPLDGSDLNSVQKRLLARVYRGDIIPVYSSRTPSGLEDLFKKGYLIKTGRPVVIQACYAPAHGYRPFEMDEVDSELLLTSIGVKD